jgi:uncharacterized protein YndB with AHSA1/START domain
MKSLLLLSNLVLALPLCAGVRGFTLETDVNAPVDQVWRAWTTDAGVRSFFSPASRVEAVPDGPFEIWFDPKAEPGKRGADGMRFLVIEPYRRIAFTWNAPMEFPEARKQRTRVTVTFTPISDKSTHVMLDHDGFGEGKEWDQVYDYFRKAWGEVVLPRLQHRFKHGPIDWSKR